jgi:hypothetical protein
MEDIKLNKSQFESFNDCDGWSIFQEVRESKYKTMSEEELADFNYEGHIQELTNQLFNEYEFILVSPDDKIWGSKNNNLVLLKEDEGAYECAVNCKC